MLLAFLAVAYATHLDQLDVTIGENNASPYASAQQMFPHFQLII